MRKKGQVTVFVIIGIVLLISTILFLVVRGRIVTEEIAPGVNVIVEELPSEFRPIGPFVESCLETTTLEGLKILGERGGYIFTETLSTNRQPTEGSAVQFSQGADLVIPYWFYLADDNECKGQCDFSSKKLPLRGRNSVEAQLERFIDERLELCINNFESMKQLNFDVLERDAPASDVTIAESDLIVQLEYPLEITRQSSYEVEDFYIEVDINLEKLYTMAEYLTETQAEYRFLERSLLNLISGFSGADKEKLPPMTDFKFERTSKVKWRKTWVKNSVEDILSSYTQLIRVLDTLNWQEIKTDSLYIDRLYNFGLSIPNNSSVNDVSVNFNYLGFWDTHFDLNCNGEICEPEAVFTDLLPIGIQRYQFVYDVSYPVLVEVTDPEALNGQGYTLQFMLESNVRNNEIMPSVFEPFETVAATTGSIFCDENKKTSGEVSLTVKDKATGDPLDGVEVLYSCIESCYIGDTKEGNLESSFPVCLGGVISLNKEGYSTTYINYDAAKDKVDLLEAELVPLKELTVELRKFELFKQVDEWRWGVEPRSLDTFDRATVQVISENSYDILDITKESVQTIQVGEGEYTFDIYLTAEEPFFIPEQVISAGGEEITIDSFDVSSFVTGSTSLSYTFTEEDLTKDKFVLYVLSADVYRIPEEDRVADDASVLAIVEQNAETYAFELTPTLE